jgi:hypothetical protein
MRITNRILFTLICLAVTQIACTRHDVRTVPTGFKYPNSGLTIERKELLLLKQIAGMVVGFDGEPIDEVLVEIISLDQGKRLAAQFTNTHGRFQFKEFKDGKYKLRFTYPLFNPLQVTIEITKTGKRSEIFKIFAS